MNYSGGPSYPAPSYAPRPQIRFDAIGEAWQLFTQQMAVWVLSVLMTMFVTAVLVYGTMFLVMGLAFGIAGGTLGRSNSEPSAGFIVGLLAGYGLMIVIAMIVSSFFMVSLHRMAIKQMRGEIISIGDAFNGWEQLPAVLGATLLIGLLAGMASVTIVGGIIVAGLWMLTIPLILDRRMGVIEAMQASWEALKEQWLMAALFYLVVGIVSSCGIYACGVGFLFTYPLLFLIHVIVYRDFFQPQGMYPGPMPYSTYPVTPYSPPGAMTPPTGGYPPANTPGTYPPQSPPLNYPPTSPPPPPGPPTG